MVFIPRNSHQSVWDFPDQSSMAEAWAYRTNRRRLRVFLWLFLLTLVPGLAWNVLRPATYRTTARLQIKSGSLTTSADTGAPTKPGIRADTAEDVQGNQSTPTIDLLTQIQVLTSRPLLAATHRHLLADGYKDVDTTSDPIVMLQNMLNVAPIPGTNIVEVEAIGASPPLLAKAVNALIAAYHDELFATHDSASQEAVSNLREEVAQLEKHVAEKRAQLAAFREKSGVVSSERTENEALARAKGLSESLNKATEEAAKAEARLHTLRESAVTGTSPVLSKDNPTQAAIEQRISSTREDLRDMERTYTPEFMAMDPTARALRARLKELEQQLLTNRTASQQAALASAEEDMAGARATVERLRSQLGAQQHEARSFSGKFIEAQALEDDLTRLESDRRSANERLAKLEASDRTRLPALTLIEAATVPQTVWRPDYLRDALINLLASFLIGLLGMWFVELFNRSPVSSSSAGQNAFVLAPALRPALPVEPTLRLAERSNDLMPDAARQLPAPAIPSRELTQDEIAALLGEADANGKAVLSLMLMGLTTAEIGKLTVKDFDTSGSSLTIHGASQRTLTLPAWLADRLATAVGDPDQPLLTNSNGQRLGENEIRASLTGHALDARLQGAATIVPEMLRHTFIAYLVRQQVRFSELGTLVGQLSTEELTAYAAINSAEGQRVANDTTDLVMPALRCL